MSNGDWPGHSDSVVFPADFRSDVKIRLLVGNRFAFGSDFFSDHHHPDMRFKQRTFSANYKRLNAVLERPTHTFKSALELVKSIPHTAKYFAKLDLAKAYLQVEIAKESRPLTAILVDGFPVLQWKRFPMGLSMSGDVFCALSDKALEGLIGVIKLVDDILIFADTREQLLERIEEVFKRCRQHGLSIDETKNEVGTSVKFGGYLVSKNSYRPSPDKLKALSQFSKITSATDIRSFCGLCVPFAQNCLELTSYLNPIRDAIRKRPVFEKGVKRDVVPKKVDMTPALKYNLEKCIQFLQRAGETPLRQYRPDLEFFMYTDASKLNGLGYVCVQYVWENGKKYTSLIMCNSRSLSTPEKNYSVTELELLAVVWAMKMMHLYTTGRHTNIITDHLPLEGLALRPRGNIKNRRLLNLVGAIDQYGYTIKYLEGKKNLMADALSRKPIYYTDAEVSENMKELGLEHINQMTATIEVPETLSVYLGGACRVFKLRSMEDKEYQDLLRHFQTGGESHDLPSDTFKSIWEDVYTECDLLMCDGKLLVTKELIPYVLRRLHMQHQGYARTYKLPNQLFYFPNMKRLIQDTIANCKPCQRYRRLPGKETMRHEYTVRPFQQLTMDIFQYKSQLYLAVSDKYSNFPLVGKVKSTSSQEVLEHVTGWVNEFGCPDVIRSDGATCFVSAAFQLFCANHGILHRTSSADFPSSNGHAERCVQSMKSLLKKCDGNWNHFRTALAEFRNTPTSYSRLSPNEWVFQRRTRTMLPMAEDAYERISNEEMRVAEAERLKYFKNCQKKYDKRAKDLKIITPGTKVYVYDNRPGKVKGFTHPGEVIAVRDPDNHRSYVVKLDHTGNTITRNRTRLLPITTAADPSKDHEKPTNVQDGVEKMSEETNSNKPRRSERLRRKDTDSEEPRRSERIKQKVNACCLVEAEPTPEYHGSGRLQICRKRPTGFRLTKIQDIMDSLDFVSVGECSDPVIYLATLYSATT